MTQTYRFAAPSDAPPGELTTNMYVSASATEGLVFHWYSHHALGNGEIVMNPTKGGKMFEEGFGYRGLLPRKDGEELGKCVVAAEMKFRPGKKTWRKMDRPVSCSFKGTFTITFDKKIIMFKAEGEQSQKMVGIMKYPPREKAKLTRVLGMRLMNLAAHHGCEMHAVLPSKLKVAENLSLETLMS